MKNATNNKKQHSILKLTMLVIQFFTILVNGTNLLAQGPGFNWAKQVGGNGGEYSKKVSVDPSGNIVELISILGTTPLDCDPGSGVYTVTGAGSFDCLIVKLDAGGNFCWAKHIGGSVNERGLSLTTDNSGNVYVTGTFTGAPDFDPGPGLFSMTSSAPGGNMFLLKLDMAGNFIWAVKTDNTGATAGNDIALDPSGNLVVTGIFSATTDFMPGAGVSNLTSAGLTDIFIAKYDPTGNLIWAKQTGGLSDDEGKAICTDGSGAVYVTGTYQLTVDFDHGAGTLLKSSVGLTDNFIVKTDASGNFLWAQTTGTPQFDATNAIAVDASGHVITAGNFRGTLDADPGAGSFMLSSSSVSDIDICITKLNGSGNFIWAKQVGCATGNGDVVTCMALDGSGNIYVAGYFSTSGDFDPGAGITTLTSSGGSDIFMLGLHAAGTLIFANSMGGSSIDYAQSISVSSTGCITLLGEFVGTSDFNPGATDYLMTSLASNYDVYTLRFGFFSALPVSLLSFTATDDTHSVNLTWSTATEKNNAYFTIEKSKNGKDFELLVTIPGSGTRSVKTDYATTDLNPFSGTTYYRLRQTDYNGEEEHLKTISVTRAENNQNQFSSFASVLDNIIQLTINSNNYSTAKIHIFDAAGRLIKTENTILNPGISHMNLNSYVLKNGIYYIQICVGESTVVSKIII